VAHIHGGDRAEGVADEAMRHAISKLAHLHLAASRQSRERLIRMGEPARSVLHTGSPAVDGLAAVAASPAAPAILVMQHPIGAGDAQESRWFRATTRATVAAARSLGASVALFAPNHDPGHAGIRRAMREPGLAIIEHLPREAFLSMLKGCRVIVGNSSAGLIEAAALRVPCVNVGPRQAGRERAGNVVDCGYGIAPVRAAIARALRLDLGRLRHPYGDGHAGERIAEALATIPLDAVPVRKRNSY
jgi:UDP-hydrolysing UDP-N-acetyl-D-glucosamine 2-epimerase